MSEYSILIVDDNELDRYILKRQLKETALPIRQIFEEEDGEAALRFFEQYNENVKKYPESYPPTLVFLDINMPLMSGHEFLAAFSELRRNIDAESVVVMMFSTSAREEEKLSALNYPFVKEFLVKGTFEVPELKNLIQSLGDR